MIDAIMGYKFKDGDRVMVRITGATDGSGVIFGIIRGKSTMGNAVIGGGYIVEFTYSDDTEFQLPNETYPFKFFSAFECMIFPEESTEYQTAHYLTFETFTKDDLFD